MSFVNDLVSIIKHPTDKTSIQFMRYVMVGGAAFLVDFGSLYLFTDIFGIYYLISAAVAFILGLVANYILSVSWVFNKRTLNSKGMEFGVFALIGVVGLILNEIFIWFFTSQVGLFYLLSKIISAIFILFWNFGARKYVLFR